MSNTVAFLSSGPPDSVWGQHSKHIFCCYTYMRVVFIVPIVHLHPGWPGSGIVVICSEVLPYFFLYKNSSHAAATVRHHRDDTKYFKCPSHHIVAHWSWGLSNLYILTCSVPKSSTCVFLNIKEKMSCSATVYLIVFIKVTSKSSGKSFVNGYGICQTPGPIQVLC